jgi:DNA-binding MarR family transcriptional regulator
MDGMSDNKPSETAVRAWAKLIRAQQALLDQVEEDLKNAGFPPLVWYDILLELHRDPDGRLRHRDLHRRMLLAKYNLSRLLDRMADDGLVDREPVADDARGEYLRITAQGRDLRRRMWPVYQRAIYRHFASRLGAGDVGELIRILEKLA